MNVGTIRMKYRTIVTDMLRALIDKVESTDGQCKQRDRNIKKGPKVKVRDQKHCKKNEECLC